MEKQQLQVLCMIRLNTFCRRAGIGLKRYPQNESTVEREYRISLVETNQPTQQYHTLFLADMNNAASKMETPRLSSNRHVCKKATQSHHLDPFWQT